MINRETRRMSPGSTTRYVASLYSASSEKITCAQAVHIELIDSNSPYIADTVVIRWDGQEVFRRCILPQHPITALLDPEISAQPHQIDIETGNVDGFKNFRFKMPAAPTDGTTLPSIDWLQG
jgi:hypothetical protein